MIVMEGLIMNEKYSKLQIDIKERRDEYNKKREEYDSKVRKSNRWLSLLPLASTIAIFISFLCPGILEMVMKVVGLVCSVLTIIYSYHVRTENYGGKLLQRTKTYFSLCRLYREMKYSEVAEENYKQFVSEFNQIMNTDNKMSLENSQIIVELLRDSYKNGIDMEKEFEQKNE